MIRSGQLKRVAEGSQFLSTVSNGEGVFTFDGVIPAPKMEIAYWGDGISQGRLEHIEGLNAEDRDKVQITITTPGAIVGKIDRKALPEVTGVELSAVNSSIGFDYQRAELSADQTSYEIRNVPPGKYQLRVSGKRTRTSTDGFTQATVQRRDVEVRSGETLTLDISATK